MSDSLDLRVAQTLTPCRQLFGLNLSTEKAEGAGHVKICNNVFYLEQKKSTQYFNLEKKYFFKEK